MYRHIEFLFCRLYELYYHSAFKWIQYLAIIVLMSLALFEEPSLWPGALEFYVSFCILKLLYTYLIVTHPTHWVSCTRYIKGEIIRPGTEPSSKK